MLYAVASGLLVNLCLDIALGSWFGCYGAAGGALAGQAVISGLLLLFIHRHVAPVPFARVLRTPVLLAMAMAGAGFPLSVIWNPAAGLFVSLAVFLAVVAVTFPTWRDDTHTLLTEMRA